ncbi:MFS transporter [Rothia sp. AR01]|uniref:MFS transporter n=1 Tax=Rothia santali TaxID=2949643 RepID=A0A9X2HB91_9MICC|nr:MFS transporter [Rothia santali]MCP3425040.1 MFS transporter [Rothia santali]
MSGAQDDAARPHGARKVTVAWFVVILLIASCLRPALTSIGPVLDQMGQATGLNAAGLGLLGALPLFAFALLSPLISVPAQRLGVERVLLVALLVLGLGILARSTPGIALLWIGTLCVGAGIAIANVLVPVIVKRDFSRYISVMTGLYTAVVSVSAGLSAGLTAPLAEVLPGAWRTALALWALIPLVCAVWWVFLTRDARRSGRGPGAKRMSVAEAVTGAMPSVAAAAEPLASRRVSMLRSPIAWQVTVFMGGQSIIFYTLSTWLPSMEAEIGNDASVAGWHMFTMQIVGIAGNLSVTFLAERWRSQSWLAMTLAGCLIVGIVGALVLPQAAVVWVGLAGIGCGGGFSLSLAMIGLRTASPGQTMRLSGMAQCLGYLMAAAGPLLTGWIAEATGTWATVLWGLLVLVVLQFVAGGLAGRDRKIGQPAA